MSMINCKKTHWTQDPKKKSQGLLKRFKTNLQKYGNKVGDRNKRSKIIKKTHQDAKNILDGINIISKKDVYKFFNEPLTHFSFFLGKAKNRTLLKNYPIIYKSLFYHTDFLKTQYIHKIKNIPFTFRLLVAGQFNFTLKRKYYCRCGRGIVFDKFKQIIKKNGFII